MSVKIQPVKWLPNNRAAISSYIRSLKEEILENDVLRTRQQTLLKLHPPAESDLQISVSNEEVKSLRFHEPVQELYVQILTDPEINMFFHQMFSQQRKIWEHKEIKGEIHHWQMFILLLDRIMDKVPHYSDSDLVGFPINALINWPMATTAGFACFLNKKVNNLFKNILNYWGKFLQSPASTYVLNSDDNGWFCKDALHKMMDQDGNTFEQQFICDPNKPHWGFTSWDDFFTRRFRKNMRPLPKPDDEWIIVNACESAPFKIERGVNVRTKFWIKKQPYSLSFMLNNNDWYKYFVGGTVYQAFLSALSYHRWHSPISGTIVDRELIDGTYYSQTFDIQDDCASPNMSQGYITQVATRAAIYIMADNPAIGIVCFLSIGMAEVSSNEITVAKGQHVNKGEQLGMFHFGGSSHCLIFRKELDVQFDISPNTKPSLDAVNIPLRRKIATVKLADASLSESKIDAETVSKTLVFAKVRPLSESEEKLEASPMKGLKLETEVRTKKDSVIVKEPGETSTEVMKTVDVSEKL